MSEQTNTQQARIREIRIERVPDDDPDVSYLDQEDMGFEDRRAAYRRGEFGYIGVRAVAELEFPTERGVVIDSISSSGVWGVKDDFDELGAEQVEELKDMLAQLGFNRDEIDS